MLKLEVYGEKTNRDGNGREGITVPTWFDVSEVFAIQADTDPEWSVLTFKPSAGSRSFIVRGEADTVASMITAERCRGRVN